MTQTNIKGTVVGSFCVPKYIMYYLEIYGQQRCQDDILKRI
jgi:hypothetical protein